MDDYADEAPAFADFYRAEYSRVAALAFSLTGDWAVAEELAQEAFLVVHRKWSRVARYDDPGQWVRRVVANHAVSSYRRRVAERQALRRLGSRPMENKVGESSGTTGPAALAAQLRTLPARQAQALALVYVEELTAAEAAAVLGCSESTLRTHLQRGRETLRSVVEKEIDR